MNSCASLILLEKLVKILDLDLTWRLFKFSESAPFILLIKLMGFDVHVILLIQEVLHFFKIAFHLFIICKVDWSHQKTSANIMFFQIDGKSACILIIPAI